LAVDIVKAIKKDRKKSRAKKPGDKI